LPLEHQECQSEALGGLRKLDAGAAYTPRGQIPFFSEQRVTGVVPTPFRVGEDIEQVHVLGVNRGDGAAHIAAAHDGCTIELLPKDKIGLLNASGAEAAVRALQLPMSQSAVGNRWTLLQAVQRQESPLGGARPQTEAQRKALEDNALPSSDTTASLTTYLAACAAKQGRPDGEDPWLNLQVLLVPVSPS
jgi:hypothetical protein